MNGGDPAVGTLISPPVVLDGARPWPMRLGGGSGDSGLRVELRVDGLAVRDRQPAGTLTEMDWDVRELRGQTRTIALVDASTAPWGKATWGEESGSGPEAGSAGVGAVTPRWPLRRGRSLMMPSTNQTEGSRHGRAVGPRNLATGALVDPDTRPTTSPRPPRPWRSRCDRTLAGLAGCGDDEECRATLHDLRRVVRHRRQRGADRPRRLRRPGL